MMMGTSSGSSHLNLNLFTAAQWEELEQQALIYKYMVSGVPVPTELILSVRRSLYNSSSSSLSNQQQQPPSLGAWEGGFQYNQLYQIGGGGYGRKIDLEPGRCRRTDGKKWRCSKEAYPDSKYCERHMHRGRNRSRKPVEFPSSSSSSSTVNVSSSSSSSVTASASASASTTTTISPSAIHSNFMDSSSYSHQTLKDYRYVEDERSAYFHQNYTNFNFQHLKDHQEKGGETQGQHCFVMGTDFIKSTDQESIKSSTQINTKTDQTTNKQPFHHFFAPPKTTHNLDPTWVEVNQHHNLINPPKSPLSTQDLFQSKPRPYW